MVWLSWMRKENFGGQGGRRPDADFFRENRRRVLRRLGIFLSASMMASTTSGILGESYLVFLTREFCLKDGHSALSSEGKNVECRPSSKGEQVKRDHFPAVDARGCRKRKEGSHLISGTL